MGYLWGIAELYIFTRPPAEDPKILQEFVGDTWAICWEIAASLWNDIIFMRPVEACRRKFAADTFEGIAWRFLESPCEFLEIRGHLVVGVQADCWENAAYFTMPEVIPILSCNVFSKV
jgi:hypothetical protein